MSTLIQQTPDALVTPLHFQSLSESGSVGCCADVGNMSAVNGRVTEGPLEGDVFEASKSADLRESNDHSKLILPTNTLADDIKYFMGHKRRGYAYLFNHENYMPISKPDVTPRTRKDSQIDVKNMEKALNSLGFKVKIITDASYKTLSAEIAKLSMMDHSDCDCVLVAVFTHGGSNALYAFDQSYQPKILWEPFLPQNCPTLAGKPKLFFIQACRGTRVDSGITLRPKTGGASVELGGTPQIRTEVDSVAIRATERGLFPFSIPSRADFLISCSTTPGFESYRDELISAKYWSFSLFGPILLVPRSLFRWPMFGWPFRSLANTAPGSGNIASEDTGQAGSWFVQTLAQVLQEFSCEEDLLSMLGIVSCRVATRFQTCIDDEYRNEKRQNPCFHSTLMRKVFFEPKPAASSSAPCWIL